MFCVFNLNLKAPQLQPCLNLPWCWSEIPWVRVCENLDLTNISQIVVSLFFDKKLYFQKHSNFTHFLQQGSLESLEKSININHKSHMAVSGWQQKIQFQGFVVIDRLCINKDSWTKTSGTTRFVFEFRFDWYHLKRLENFYWQDIA